MATLVSIVYKPKDAGPPRGAYVRVPMTEARLVAGHGIEGDAKGGGQNRQLNVMAVETMRTLAADGFHADPGRLGEQLALEGVPVDTLPKGARLRIGNTAVVEVVEPRNGCGRFEEYQGKLREEAAGRLGVMARVLEGGPVAVGDTVALLECVMHLS